jgi:hypothetical protein
MPQDNASVTAHVEDGFRKLGLPIDDKAPALLPEIPNPPQLPTESPHAQPKFKIVIGDSTR